MNRKLIVLMIGMFLVSFAVAGIAVGSVISKDAIFTRAEVTTLSSVGISTPVVSNCEKLDDFSCRFNIYQKDGINKDATVVIKECSEYEDIITEEEFINEDNETEIRESNKTVCKTWWNLNQAEIETRVQEKTKSILQNIAEVTDVREAKSKEYLTDAIELTIKEK